MFLMHYSSFLLLYSRSLDQNVVIASKVRAIQNWLWHTSAPLLVLQDLIFHPLSVLHTSWKRLDDQTSKNPISDSFLVRPLANQTDKMALSDADVSKQVPVKLSFVVTVHFVATLLVEVHLLLLPLKKT